MTSPARLEPLRVRPGARFACFGDGLCCSDIHAIGALSDRDCAMVGAITENAIAPHVDGSKVLLMRAEDGQCVFLQEAGCAIHAALGEQQKPSPCIRFPFGLTATPSGARVTTQHRCPCRTVGDRPAITAETARPSLLGEGGEPTADHMVEGEVPWSSGELFSFETYERRESEFLERLLGSDRLRDVLAAEPFPPLATTSWDDVAHEMQTLDGGSRLEVAIQWFGDALGALLSRRPRPARGRPWHAAFDRASGRAETSRTANAVFADWIADEVWSLHWTDWGSFERARAEWATRLMVARKVAAWRIEDGSEEELAAAEAVMVVETVAHSDWWDDVLQAIAVP